MSFRTSIGNILLFISFQIYVFILAILNYFYLFCVVCVPMILPVCGGWTDSLQQFWKRTDFRSSDLDES